MARCAIQHNGLFGKVRPVAALKLRLVAAPLRAQPFAPWRVYQTPVMSCAPTPCACGMAHLRQAARGQPLASAVSAAPKPQRVLARRWRAVRGVGPRPPCGARRLRAFGPRREVARPPPKGAPSTPGAGVRWRWRWRWQARCLCRRRSRLAGASPGKQPEQPARRCAPCPSRGAPTPSLFVGEGAPAVPGSKGQASALRSAVLRSLDSLAPLTPVSLMRGGVPLHARRAGCHYRPPLFIHH